MRFGNTQKIISSIIILSAIFIGVIFFVLVPFVKNTINTAKETDRLKLYMEQKYEASKRTRIDKKQIDKIKTNANVFEKYIFSSGEELKLITFLEETAGRHHITQSIDSSNLDKITNNQIRISLSLSGSYTDIFVYLRELESSFYFINAEQIELSPIFDRGGSLTPMTEAHLTISVYVNP